MRELCWRFLALFSVFARQKVTHNGNITFTDYTSGIWHPFCSKLVVNWKNSNDVTIFLHEVILTFLCFFVFLFNFSYWSKLHVNIMTGSEVMTVSFCKALTRNPEIGNTPIWALPNIWRLGQVSNTRFGRNVFDKMLLNATILGLLLLSFLSY